MYDEGVGWWPEAVSSEDLRQADLFFRDLLGESTSRAWSEDVGDDSAAETRGSRMSLAGQATFGAQLSFRPPASVQRAIKARGMRFHRIEDATGDINLDLFTVRIQRMPNRPGTSTPFTPDGLVEHVRLNINDFINTTLSTFAPYESRDRAPWTSASPVGAVISIDLAGPDNASVVCSRRFRNLSRDQSNWTFSTAHTPNDGGHPVSGNRKFGIFRSSTGDLVFFTRGTDRLTTLLDRAAGPIAFALAERLWDSLQEGVIDFVRTNGGAATKGFTSSHRYDWPSIRSRLYRPTTAWI